jgi:predicted enzyme related to lactoylglutathione lyase
LNNAPVHPNLPVVDLERAVRFYRDKLGLKLLKAESPSETFAGAILQAGGGTIVYLYKRGATKADHTAAEFVVKDFDEVIKSLRSRGVVFEEYNLPNLKTANGVATWGDTKSAWFKDTEGNILAISNMTW